MPVIDLDSGAIVKDRPDIAQEIEEQQPQAVQQQRQGGIIDLETGQFIQQQAQQPQVEAQAQRSSFPGASIIEPLATIATGALAEPVAGLVGLATAPFVGVEQAAENIRATQDLFTFEPRTEAGQQALSSVGEFLAPVGEALSGIEKALGEETLALTGSPELAAIAHTLPTAILEGIGLKGIKRTARSAPRQVTQQAQDIAEQASVTQARAAAEVTGIGLFKAQQTLNPTDIERQSFIAQLPEGAVKARQALLTQNQQAFNAVDEFLGQLAPPESIINAAPKFRTASQRAVEGAKDIRRQKASPLFNEAFDQGADVNISTVNDLIDNQLLDLPEGGEISKSLKKVKTLIKGKKPKGSAITLAPSLKQLHNAKLEIDQMLNKFGTDSLGNTTKAKLAEVKDNLLTQIDEASPLYRQAREAFAESSPNVDKVNDSIIGRVAGFNDAQLKSIAQRVFDPAETNPQVIASAKRSINDVDPGAWNALLRSELERRMGRIRADIGDLSSTAALENIPAQLFNSIFGNKKSRDVLFKALDGEQRQNLKYLETSLRRATKGRPGGSQTAIREEIKRELRGGVFQSFREFFKAPASTIASIGEDAAFNQRTRALADIMFDPSFSGEITRIRDLPPASSQAKRRMDALLNSALVLSPGAAVATQQEQQ